MKRQLRATYIEHRFLRFTAVGMFSLGRPGSCSMEQPNASTEAITEVITTLIKLMVDHPAEVSVKCISTEDVSSLSISVAQDDLGKVIGRQGRTARSLRVVATAMGMATKQRIRLDIQE